MAFAHVLAYLTPMTVTFTPKGVRTISWSCRRQHSNSRQCVQGLLHLQLSGAEHEASMRANQTATCFLACSTPSFNLHSMLFLQSQRLTFRPNSLRAAALVSNAGSLDFFLPPACEMVGRMSFSPSMACTSNAAMAPACCCLLLAPPGTKFLPSWVP